MSGDSAYRILVTGSRTWNDDETIAKALNSAYLATNATAPVTLVHGACPHGADALAAAWVVDLKQSGWLITEERHPADWKRFGHCAGYLRNTEMVDLGAAVCLAFVDWCVAKRCPKQGRHGSHGAVGCAELADKAGIPVRPYGIERERWAS